MNLNAYNVPHAKCLFTSQQHEPYIRSLMDKALVIPQNTWHQHIWVNFDICQVNASQGNEKTMSICLVDIYEVLGIATNFPN